MFAEVEDLEARFRKLIGDEAGRATALLADASVMLQAEFDRCDKKIDTEDELLMANLKRVCCSMVKRVIASGVDADISSMSLTAGSYSEQCTFSNPSGDIYITKNERKSLGIPMNRQRIGSILPVGYPGTQG